MVAAWVIILAASLPALFHYSSYISYITSTPGLSRSESARAQSLLSTVQPQNESLLLVVKVSPSQPQTQLAKATLNFQKTLKSSGVPNLSSTQSAFSSYAQFIDQLVSSYAPAIRASCNNFTQASNQIYSYPSEFLKAWISTGYSHTSIKSVLESTNCTGQGYELAFYTYFNATLEAHPTFKPATLVQNAVYDAVSQTMATDPYIYAALSPPASAIPQQ